MDEQLSKHSVLHCSPLHPRPTHQDVALAHSLASRHYSAVGRLRTATWHLTEAHEAYTEWGAAAVVQRLPVASLHHRPGRHRARASRSPGRSASPSTDSALRTTTIDSAKPPGTLSEDSLDVRAVLAASQTLSSEIVREALLEKLLNIVIEVAGARYVVLVLQRPGEGGWYLEGSASAAGRAAEASPAESADAVLTKLAPMPLSAAGALVPQALVLYVSRTQEVVMVRGGAQAAAVKDSYLDRHQPQSVLCMPIVRHGGEGREALLRVMIRGFALSFTVLTALLGVKGTTRLSGDGPMKPTWLLRRVRQRRAFLVV